MPCGYVRTLHLERVSVRYSICHILREASAGLLVQRRWAIPEPPFVERATVWFSRNFFILTNNLFVKRTGGISLSMKKLSLCLALITLLFVSGVGYAQDSVSRKKEKKIEQPRPSNPGAKRKTSAKQQRNEYPSLTPYEMNEKGDDAYNKNNYAEAVKWYRKAAEQGYARAQTNFGYMYEKGYGVTQNYTEAVKWYRKAAEQGEAMAQNNLGWMYQYGYGGVTKNIAEARRWYEKAAAQGNELAKNNLKNL